jgi:hypothetical protein
MVGVDQEGGAVAGDRVEVDRGRGRTREVGLMPTTAEDPGEVRVLIGVPLDDLLVRR